MLLNLAGLLAFPLFELPSHLPFGKQWRVYSKSLTTKWQDYSYGDSAGISPDFPFHPDMSGTRTLQK